ncbi:MAG: ATP-binding protein [Acidimicrobiales bacterium]
MREWSARGILRNWGRSQSKAMRASQQSSESSEVETPLLQELAATLDALNIGIVVCDASGDIVFTNRYAESLFNGNYQDALAARALAEVIELARKGEFSERTFELYGPPKRSYALRSLSLDIRSGEEFVALLEDVSSKKHLDDVRRDFVTNVSHELKTPIAAMQLLAETMTLEEESSVLRRLASRIEKEASRLNHIVDDLLDLSRIESEEDTTVEIVELNSVLNEVKSRVLAAAEVKGVELSITMPQESSHVLGHRHQLISAIYNLVDNAIKYSEQGSKVTLAVRTEPEWTVITVADQGIGIPSRDQERIFERFYRVDQNRSRSTGGTGLGLSIVRHVISNHRGRVTVDSTEGVGSTFTVWLPSTNQGAS